MTRVCFTLQVHPNHIAEYKRRHRDVWPEMRQALTAAGWHDYSLFLRPDGLLIGYLVTPDFAQAKAAMAPLDVNRRWQAQMADLFDGLTENPDTTMQALEEVFHLD